jgi:serine/threonine-protein kinase
MTPQPLGSDYLLGEQIGEGGRGAVWRGQDRWTGAVRAIKVLRPEYAADRADVVRLMREREALVSFRHPSVVAVYDVLLEGEPLAIVMDLVTGRDLNTLRDARGGHLGPGEAAWLTAQLADALAAGHTAGIVHGDLKPADALVTEEGEGDGDRALVTDFGIARLAGGTAGASVYAAPELMRGGAPGPAADVYALGVILYELVAGEPPAPAPARPPGIRDELWWLISGCLDSDPAARPSAGVVSAELHDLAGSHPPAAEPEIVPARAGADATRLDMVARIARSRPRTVMLVSAVAGLVLLAVAVMGFGPFGWSGKEPSTAVAVPGDVQGGVQPSTSGASTPRGSASPKTSATPSPRASATARAKHAAKPRASATASRSASASSSTATLTWYCSAEKSQTFVSSPMTTKACIAVQGTTVHLKGYLWTVPAVSLGTYQVRLVLTSSSGSTTDYTSPDCTAGTCTYSVTVAEPAGSYQVRADYLFDGVNNMSGYNSPSETVK